MLNSCYTRVVLYHPIHLSRLVSTLESLEWFPPYFQTTCYENIFSNPEQSYAGTVGLWHRVHELKRKSITLKLTNEINQLREMFFFHISFGFVCDCWKHSTAMHISLFSNSYSLKIWVFFVNAEITKCSACDDALVSVVHFWNWQFKSNFFLFSSWILLSSCIVTNGASPSWL